MTTRAPPPGADEGVAEGINSAEYSDRHSLLRESTQWQFSGRIAYSSERDSGSGRIDWRQEGDVIDIQLSAPVTRQSWKLHVDASGARLEGLEDGTLQADSADELLASQLGFSIPLSALADWLRGVVPRQYAVTEARIDSRGRPITLVQEGWTVSYPDWHSMQPVDLPRRVFAERSTDVGRPDRVRIVVDTWHLN